MLCEAHGVTGSNPGSHFTPACAPGCVPTPGGTHHPPWGDGVLSSENCYGRTCIHLTFLWIRSLEGKPRSGLRASETSTVMSVLLQKGVGPDTLSGYAPMSRPHSTRAFGPGGRLIPQTLELCLPAAWSLDIRAGDVSDGWGPGALSLTVPLCAWSLAWGEGTLLLCIPNKRHL